MEMDEAGAYDYDKGLQVNLSTSHSIDMSEKDLVEELLMALDLEVCKARLQRSHSISISSTK